jgi:hypothetical protein
LTDHWYSIKKNDLEPIKEYRTQKEADEDKKKMAESRLNGAKDQPKSGSGLVNPLKNSFPTPKPTASSKAKQVLPMAASSGSARALNPVARGNFSKGLEELDKIQKKLHSAGNLRGRKAIELGDSELQYTVDESGFGTNEESKRDRLSNRRATTGMHSSTLTKKTPNSSGNKEQSAAAQTQVAGKKLNVLKCNRMVDEIALVFSQGFKRIEEFEKEAGVQIRIADFTKEYQKLIESMRDVTKNQPKLK